MIVISSEKDVCAGTPRGDLDYSNWILLLLRVLTKSSMWQNNAVRPSLISIFKFMCYNYEEKSGGVQALGAFLISYI